jgi:hypothetical protein
MLQGRATESEWMDGPDFGPRPVTDTFRLTRHFFYRFQLVLNVDSSS